MVGRAASLESRLKTHHTSNPRLTTVHEIEAETHTAAAACEAYLKGFLQAKRLPGTDEFFELSTAEAHGAAEEGRRYLAEDLPRQKEAARLAHEDCDGSIVKPGDADWEAYRRLMLAREAEYRAGAEKVRLENQLKLRIGRAAELEGVATWRAHRQRKFDEAEFKAANPDLWDDFRRVRRVRRFLPE